MNNKRTYIPHLDGLRALSVVMVILFHSNRDWIPGGFIGVDIFFVLSGFLITQIIVSDLESNRYSYAGFLLRRGGRLVPAYYLMISCCLLIAPFILLPTEFENLASSAGSATVFLSNLFFYNNSGYFDIESERQILLHTWSLAVEWQFYLVYPVVLWCIHRYVGARYVLGLCVLWALSLWVSMVFVGSDRSFAFYMLPTRAWELLSGALLSFLYMRGHVPVKERWSLSVVGISLIIYAMFYYSESTPFPGAKALVPIIGAVLLMLNGLSSGGGMVTRCLSFAPLVLIGQMSYSLYLWHWPALLFSRTYLQRELTFGELLGTWTLIFIASYFSWKYVESIFRVMVNSSAKIKAAAGFLSAAAALILVVVLIDKFNGFEGRLDERALVVANTERWAPFPGQCLTKEGDRYHNCKIGSLSSEETVLFWGDSHAQSMIWEIDRFATENNLAIRQVTKGECPPILTAVPFDMGIHRQPCWYAQQAVRTFLHDVKSIDTVVISARWILYEGKRMGEFTDGMVANGREISFEEALAESLDILLDSGVEVVLIDSFPEPGFDVPNELARSMMLGRDFDAVFPLGAESDGALSRMVDIEHESLHILDLNRYLCVQGSCPLMVDDLPLYMDDDHLSRHGVRQIRKGLENNQVFGGFIKEQLTRP